MNFVILPNANYLILHVCKLLLNYEINNTLKYAIETCHYNVEVNTYVYNLRKSFDKNLHKIIL